MIRLLALQDYLQKMGLTLDRVLTAGDRTVLQTPFLACFFFSPIAAHDVQPDLIAPSETVPPTRRTSAHFCPPPPRTSQYDTAAPSPQLASRS